MSLRRLAPLSALVAIAVLASPVAADCDQAGPLDKELPVAAIAFVGTVTEVDGGSARFAVHEVWAGDIGPVVEVVGGAWFQQGRRAPGAPAPIAEDDRLWEVGTRYLVLPVPHEGVLTDNQCTATTEWQPELAELRPLTAEILDPSVRADDVPIALIVVGVVAALAVGASVLAFRRR